MRKLEIGSTVKSVTSVVPVPISEPPKKTKPEMTYVAMDPGLKHCGVAILNVTQSEATRPTVEILWSETYDLSGAKTNPDSEKARELGDDILEKLFEFQPIDVVLIEYQPPLNTLANPALVRWNSWIEGFLFGYLSSHYYVRHSYPSSVKRFFNIQGGNHRVNKRLVERKAREFVSGLTSDHEADCVLMSLYDYMK